MGGSINKRITKNKTKPEMNVVFVQNFMSTLIYTPCVQHQYYCFFNCVRQFLVIHEVVFSFVVLASIDHETR